MDHLLEHCSRRRYYKFVVKILGGGGGGEWKDTYYLSRIFGKCIQDCPILNIYLYYHYDEYSSYGDVRTFVRRRTYAPLSIRRGAPPRYSSFENSSKILLNSEAVLTLCPIGLILQSVQEQKL